MNKRSEQYKTFIRNESKKAEQRREKREKKIRQKKSNLYVN